MQLSSVRVCVYVYVRRLDFGRVAGSNERANGKPLPLNLLTRLLGFLFVVRLLDVTATGGKDK